MSTFSRKNLSRYRAGVLVLMLGLGIGWVQAEVRPDSHPPRPVTDDHVLQVQVAEPYIEWRNGPGQGYPVFHVSERGEWLSVLMRKTQWLKVRDRQGREGWVSVTDLQLTRAANGEPFSLAEPHFDDFQTRRWEAGLMMGQFDRAAITALYAGYALTENLSAELGFEQILGSAAESRLATVSIVHQLFPDWRCSPFFTLGAGTLFIQPKATLAETSDRSEEVVQVGLGARIYLTERHFLRLEVKDYTIFTDRTTNEEATAWKLGLSVFF